MKGITFLAPLVLGILIGIGIATAYLNRSKQQDATGSDLNGWRAEVSGVELVSDLPVGKIVHIAPWSVRLDSSGDKFILPNSRYILAKGGTMSLPIEKTPDGKIVAYALEVNPPHKLQPAGNIKTGQDIEVIFK